MGYSRLELNGKVAVVIGGSSGIGRTLAHGLAEAGADVVPSARRVEPVKTAADQIESLGRKSLRVTCDVTDRGSLESLLKATVEAFGKVDILVNSAGFNLARSIGQQVMECCTQGQFMIRLAFVLIQLFIVAPDGFSERGSVECI